MLDSGSVDLVTDRSYLASTDLGTFGTGLSWWFPERAAAFVERENLPGQIFNSYNEGGYLTWHLGPKYPDYVDGRALPFGASRDDGALLLGCETPSSATTIAPLFSTIGIGVRSAPFAGPSMQCPSS